MIPSPYLSMISRQTLGVCLERTGSHFSGSCPEAPLSIDLLQAFLVSRPIADVKFRRPSDRRNLRGLEGTDHPGQRADDQRMFGILLAFRDHRSRTDDASAASPFTLHHERAHPDKRVIFQR